MADPRLGQLRALHAQISKTRERWQDPTLSQGERALEFNHLASLHAELDTVQGALAAEQIAEAEAARPPPSEWLVKSREVLAERSRLQGVLKDTRTDPVARAEAERDLAALPSAF